MPTEVVHTQPTTDPTSPQVAAGRSRVPGERSSVWVLVYPATIPILVGLGVIIYSIVSSSSVRFAGPRERAVSNQGEIKGLAPEPAKAGLEAPKPTSPAEAKPAAAPLQREWTNTIGMKLVRIEPGEFLMGSSDLVSVALTYEKPQHRVQIGKGFSLGAREVTQGQYQEVMGQNPSSFKESNELPVESLSWLEAVYFCNRLSEREHRPTYYRINGEEVAIEGGSGYRLPTEAEWEYAARAGTKSIYPFGEDQRSLGEYEWYDANSEKKSHAGGGKRPNGWGLYDMLGNVLEWCGDWFDAKYYTISPVADPPGPAQGSLRCIRGASWSDVGNDCRPAYRGASKPGSRFSNLGFRVAAGQE